MKEAPAARSSVWHRGRCVTHALGTCCVQHMDAVRAGEQLLLQSDTLVAQSGELLLVCLCFELLEKVGQLQQILGAWGPRVCSWV